MHALGLAEEEHGSRIHEAAISHSAEVMGRDKEGHPLVFVLPEVYVSPW